MITNFCDFSQFLSKKLAFFLNTNVVINFFQKFAMFWVKNANFLAKFFGENTFKKHNIGPWSNLPSRKYSAPICARLPNYFVYSAISYYRFLNTHPSEQDDKRHQNHFPFGTIEVKKLNVLQHSSSCKCPQFACTEFYILQEVGRGQ
jgi:hypothetical protein